MRTVEFRIERANGMINRGTIPFSDANVLVLKDWDTWNEQWKVVRERVLNKLLGRKLAQPLVSDSLLESQEEFDMVLRGIGNPRERIAQSPIIHRLEVASGQKFDEEGAPMPTGFDPDFAAYRAVDNRIKAGEEAAKTAGATVKDAAKSNVGLMVLGGVGLVLVGGVLAKVYL